MGEVSAGGWIVGGWVDNGWMFEVRVRRWVGEREGGGWVEVVGESMDQWVVGE